MRTALIIGAAAAALAGGAQASELVLEGVVGRVEVIPENRGDVVVTATPGSRLRAPRVIRQGGRVVVDGGLDVNQCNSNNGRMSVRLRSGERLTLAEAPVITVRAPRNLSIVSRRGAVSGRVGPAGDLTLASGGCSRWSVADVSGSLTLRQSGGSHVSAGSARTARFGASGGARIEARAVSSLDASASGGARIEVAQLSGPAKLDASGGAGVRVDGGRTGLLRAGASGGAWVEYGGVADGLDAAASGGGRVRVAQVTGPQINRSQSGGGRVVIGR